MSHRPDLRICDVSFATTGAQVIATDTHRVTLPDVVGENGQRQHVSVDVSEKGLETIKKLEDDAREATRKAYEPLRQLLDKIKS